MQIQSTSDLARVYQDSLQFAQSQNLPPALQQELLAATSDIGRRLLRYGAQRTGCSIFAAANAVRIEWLAQRGKLASDSSAMYLGPLPARTLPNLSDIDSSITVAGWRWMPREPISRVTLISRPHPREKECGDMALVMRSAQKLRLVVADGLGHGPAAREAALRAVVALRKDVHMDVSEAVFSAHYQVALTRGATLGVADIDLQNRMVRGTTVGNVRVVVFHGAGRTWSPCGSDAVLGHGRGNQGRLDVRVEQHPLPEGATVCMFSDGLASQLRLPWQRAEQDDLAAQLFMSFSLPNDDATLLLAS